MNPIPNDITQLAHIAAETGHEYADAYAVWMIYNRLPEVYLIIDTVLWIARNQGVPVKTAIELYQAIEDQFG
ncbi:hypothetical protein ACFSUS_12695 [Spirosoma soli]|uniref:Uncharacterized protein n=1 Tax=Spirosoma soli TaxID=1770529 RepID=A0ABW5M597_9BACT